MKLSLTDLAEGISWWLQKKAKWPRDFHNAVYYELYNLRKNGLSSYWWDKTVDRLWDWRAIRPLSKSKITERGLETLSLMQETYTDLCAKTQSEPSFVDFDWQQLADFYSILANIKASNSPVFPSKLGHFIFPKIFIVMDNQATGANDYQVFWQSMKEAWNNFDEKEKARSILAEAISKCALERIHANYPFETKIIELCSIGRNAGSDEISNAAIGQRIITSLEKNEKGGVGVSETKMNHLHNNDSGKSDFENFKGWLSEADLERGCFTLGYGKPFSAQYNKKDGSITITNSEKNSYTIRNAAIRMIFERWKSVSESLKYTTKTYGLGAWSGCPHRDAPAIAAIIKRWVEES